MHLLAVDDEPTILELLQLLIQTLGDHTVTTATSVAEALEILDKPETPAIDCFLIDIQMPDTDGISLCGTLRARPEYQLTPILMLTAMTDKSYIDRAFAAGASDYITKPFDVDNLRGRIQLINDLSKSSRQTAISARSKAEPEPLGDGSTTLALHEPIFVQDVDGCITYLALENYVSLMSRKKLFGSSIIGFTIRDIEELHRKSSRYEYECIVTDVAEAISVALEEFGALISYAGNGTYLCVLEYGSQLSPDKLADQVNLILRSMELYSNDGTPINAFVSAGEQVRLVWKSGQSAVDALATAHESAERESGRHARNLEDFWYDKDSMGF
ncbi:response regulator [Roseovarius sp. SK2]|uniref:response regulator n=1 Tax=Roseovarius TaxID=74030 RepID=UPI00237A72A4|nr:response regulator [Roseovarius sp. SK2]MDD9724472.1 response regulator [Roseovarius sp. SK2]